MLILVIPKLIKVQLLIIYLNKNIVSKLLIKKIKKNNNLIRISKTMDYKTMNVYKNKLTQNKKNYN